MCFCYNKGLRAFIGWITVVLLLSRRVSNGRNNDYAELLGISIVK